MPLVEIGAVALVSRAELTKKLNLRRSTSVSQVMLEMESPENIIKYEIH